MKLEDVIKRGTTAGKPAATAVPTGTLYYDTDLSQMERSNGTTWDVVEGTGGIAATIVDAKGDLIAATAADTVSRLAVGSNDTALVADSAQATGLKWAAITDAMLSTSDVATNNASTTKHGFLKKLDNDPTHFMDGQGNWTLPPGSGLTQEQVEDAVAALAVAGTNMTITYNDAVPSLTFDAAGGSGAPSTAEYVTTASDGTLSAEVAIPGLAGSADRKGILDGVVAAGGISEEYDTSTTGLTWNSAPSVVDSDTTHKSHLYVKTLSNTEYIGTRSWSPAGALDARAHIAGGIDVNANYSPSIGIHIGNSGNTSRVLINMQNNPGTGGVSDGVSVRAFTYSGGSYTGLGAGGTNIGVNSCYVRITRDGSNNWTFYVSDNGLVWIRIASASLTFTVANIGYRINPGTASAGYYVSDWLRTDV